MKRALWVSKEDSTKKLRNTRRIWVRVDQEETLEKTKPPDYSLHKKVVEEAKVTKDQVIGELKKAEKEEDHPNLLEWTEEDLLLRKSCRNRRNCADQYVPTAPISRR